MYLRFVSPVAPGGYTVTRSHVAPGLFGPAYQLWRQHRDAPSPALIGIRREIDWFEDNLPVPRRLGVKAKGRWYRDGVCWFRDSAREMLGHAYTLAALIEECGVRIDRVRSRDPGQILYRDDWQVVAMPEKYREIRSIPPPAGLLSFIWRSVCRGNLGSQSPNCSPPACGRGRGWALERNASMETAPYLSSEIAPQSGDAC